MRFDARRSLVLILVGLAVTCIFTKLALGYLPSYDDGYYAQKAREILSAGDWLTLRVGGRLRFDNPPGFMWLIALSYKLFGVDEFSARFPSALGGLFAILGTFSLFELLISRRVGFLSAVILCFTTLFLKYARHSMMDVTVAAAGVWSAYFFIRGLRGQPLFFLLAGLLGSYVPFAKSLFGLAPPAIYLSYIVLTRQGGAFKRWPLWVGLILYGAPYAGWCAYEYAIFGRQFLESHFVLLLFGMATHGGADDHHYDYVLVLLKYFPIYLPFMLYGIVFALKARGDAWRAHVFGLVYFTVYFVMLSAQSTTKTWYFISAFPACAGLAAVGVDRMLARFTLEQMARTVAGLGFIIYLVIQMTPLTLGQERAVDTKRLAPYVRAAAEQGFALGAYHADYFGLNSSLLFYADHDAPSMNDNDLAQLLAKQPKVALIFDTGEWARLAPNYPDLRVIRTSTKLTLVAKGALVEERIF